MFFLNLAKKWWTYEEFINIVSEKVFAKVKLTPSEEVWGFFLVLAGYYRNTIKFGL